jgi:hypothetical protein
MSGTLHLHVSFYKRRKNKPVTIRLLTYLPTYLPTQHSYKTAQLGFFK